VTVVNVGVRGIHSFITMKIFISALLAASGVDALRPGANIRRTAVQMQDAPSYQELWFNQTLDHFRFIGSPRAKFQQRYLLNDDHWGSKISTDEQDPSGASGCKGPILFYTGS